MNHVIDTEIPTSIAATLQTVRANAAAGVAGLVDERFLPPGIFDTVVIDDAQGRSHPPDDAPFRSW
jgi:hypothetical protein